MKRLMSVVTIPLVTFLFLAGCGTSQPSGPPPGLVFSTATAAATATAPASAGALHLYPTPGQVSALAWSPDGTRLATASGGSQGAHFQVWDATSGKPLTSYGDQLAFPCCLAWSPDGRRILSGGELATGADSNKLRIWDAATGQLLTEFVSNRGDVHIDAQAAAWSPDGKKIAVVVLLFYQPPATAFPPEEAQIWDAATGKLLSTYQVASAALNQPFSAIAWSPDSAKIALSDGTSAIQIWDVPTGKLLLTYQGHNTPVQALAWSPNGKFIASASGYPEVQVWNPMTGALVFRYQGHTAGVDALAWSPDGKRIVSGSQSADGVGEDHPIQIWDAFTGQHPFYYAGLSSITALAWSPDGTRIAASSSQNVQVWQTPPEN